MSYCWCVHKLTWPCLIPYHDLYHESCSNCRHPLFDKSQSLSRLRRNQWGKQTSVQGNDWWKDWCEDWYTSDESERLAYGSWEAGDTQPMTVHPIMNSHCADSGLWWSICAGKTHFFSPSGIQTVDVWNDNSAADVTGKFKATDRFILVRIAQQGYSLSSWAYYHIQKSDGEWLKNEVTWKYVWLRRT